MNFSVIVVDFGTAVTFDIVDTRPAYIGGVIAPGLESMTRYLHDRTALLPRIEIEEPDGAIGKSTRHAMLPPSLLTESPNHLTANISRTGRDELWLWITFHSPSTLRNRYVW